MNDPRFRQRRITIEWEDTGHLAAAFDADTGESILVDPARFAILMDGTWWILARSSKEIAFPRDVIEP